MKRGFINSGVILVLLLLQLGLSAQIKKLYISNDDHTDYMWTANEASYQTAFLEMLDWWIHYNDSTAIANTNPDYKSKWNCDGTFWVSVYEKNRSAAQFNTLINQIKNGQITVPYSPLVNTYGAMPAEAVLRGMYYAGDLERRFSLDLNMATAMENQILPLGLTSLWKGAGAKYCWHGVCACGSSVPNLDNRDNEMYWYKGLDTNRILLKWYKLDNLLQNTYLGGYAEARQPLPTVDGLSAKCNTPNYPYNIAAGFGVGHDDLETLTDQLIQAAQLKSDATQRVIVSNEVDFFQDFENTYGGTLPEVTQTFGNEWDHNCASIAEVSAKVKRSIEKLRAAEAMATIVTNYNPNFAAPLDSLRKEAWMAIGLFWEHSLGFDGNVPLGDRDGFQRRLEVTIASYVDQLYTLAKNNLANLITNSSPGSKRFFAFNPLGWLRTDYADYKYNGSQNIHVVDVIRNTEVPFQFITKNSIDYLRILADSIPSVGYKVFEIKNGPGLIVFQDAGTNIGNVIESDSFKITYTNQGVLTSIIDKHNGNKEIVLPTGGKYVNDLGSGNNNNGTSSVQVGPVSITVLTSSAAPLAHTTRITLFKNIPRIEIDNQITEDFGNTNTWAYSFNVVSPTVWHEETGAVIKAKLTSNGGHYAIHNARYDWSTLNHFASVNETNYGVTLSNQDCYFMKLGNSTISTLDENSAQLNVLAGGQIDGLGINAQGGDNIFNQRFAITTHNEYSPAAEMKRALEHQNFMVCDSVYNPVNFLLPDVYSYVSNNDPGSLIWALKPAEEGLDRGTVARVWNLSNTNATPLLSFNLNITSAKRITHVETDMNLNPFSGKDLPVTLGHNEMKSFLVKQQVIALPVKLISFTGDKIGGLNELRWNAATEAGLKTYELERSANGQKFIKIAIIPAGPETANRYSYSDKNIDFATPYYYRLKMVNDNNSFGYSNTILIKAANEASNLIIFPNPATNVLKLNLILDKKIRCNIVVINAAGAVVKTVSPPLFERGYNYYTMSVNELPAGQYTISVIAANKNFVQSFIKN